MASGSILETMIELTGEDCKRMSNSVEISAQNAIPPLNLEDIQLHLIDDLNSTPKGQMVKDKEITSNSDENLDEMEQNPTCPVKSTPGEGEGKNAVQRRRRIGVVVASDTVFAERRNARVLQKKFGEGMISETPRIFNKKL